MFVYNVPLRVVICRLELPFIKLSEIIFINSQAFIGQLDGSDNIRLKASLYIDPCAQLINNITASILIR